MNLIPSSLNSKYIIIIIIILVKPKTVDDERLKLLFIALMNQDVGKEIELSVNDGTAIRM